MDRDLLKGSVAAAAAREERMRSAWLIFIALVVLAVVGGLVCIPSADDLHFGDMLAWVLS